MEIGFVQLLKFFLAFLFAAGLANLVPPNYETGTVCTVTAVGIYAVIVGWL